MTLTRRHFLAATAAAAAVPTLASCGGFSTAGSDSGGASEGGALTFTTWGTDAELAGFRRQVQPVCGNLTFTDADFTAVERFKAGQQAQQGGFAAARRPKNGDKLALVNL